MKFGGTSVGSADAIAKMAGIVASSKNDRVVVVSAMTGVTDLLLHSADVASKGQRAEIETIVKQIHDKHAAVIKQLGLAEETGEKVNELVDALKDQLIQVTKQKQCSPAERDYILSFGERLSASLVSAAIAQQGAKSAPVEATKLIVTSRQHGNAEPYLDESTKRAKAMLRPLIAKKVVPVVTGFIGATTDGITTTLGRGASDYTATILGYCLNAKEVLIWTDVTGIMTADPSSVSGTAVIAELSYREAAELSYFGAKVIHPLTMVPASQKNIPIRIKNTFEPEAAGTRISAKTIIDSQGVKAVTSRSNLSLITVHGAGIIGAPSIAAKVLGVLASDSVDVFLISQASSERNISFIVNSTDSILVAEKIRATLRSEMSNQRIDTVQLQNSLAIVAVVGSDVNTTPGITSKAFASLGKAGIEVVAIAHGSSSHSLSLAVDGSQADLAVKTLHQAFQLTKGGKGE